MGAMWPHPEGLVAGVVRGGAARSAQATLPPRLVSRACLLSMYRGGSDPLRLFNVYAPADGSAAASADCAELVARALAAAAGLG